MGEQDPGPPWLPGYEVGAPARHGAHGPVWTATSRRGEAALVHTVALPEGERRAAALRGLDALRGEQHPGLARVLAVVDTDDGGCVLVSEVVPGRSLAAVLDSRGRLSTAELDAVRRAVAGALAHLHGAGVVHGNVNPDTVLVTPAGSVVLVDLAGEVPGQGAAGFVPPECEAGGAPSPSGDVWGLGRLLQWCGGEEAPGADLAPLLSPDPRGRPAAAEVAGPGPAASVPALSTADRTPSSGTERTSTRSRVHGRGSERGRHRARAGRPGRVRAAGAALTVAAVAGTVAVVQAGGGGGSGPDRQEMGAIVAELLARRDVALREQDPEGLAALTVPGTEVAEQDRHLLSELSAAGAVPRGLTTKLVDADVLRHGPDFAVVDAVIVQEAYRWSGNGENRSVAPQPPRCVRLELVGPEPWRLRATGPCEVSG